VKRHPTFYNASVDIWLGRYADKTSFTMDKPVTEGWGSCYVIVRVNQRAILKIQVTPDDNGDEEIASISITEYPGR